MRLRAGQLSSSLKRNGLAPLYLVCGDEPLQLIECVDEIRSQARNLGFAERLVYDVEAGFDWKALLMETATASLFSPKRIIELRLGNVSPGKEGGAALCRYAEKPAVDTILVVSAGKFDKQAQQTKWFTALDRAGVIIQVWPLTPGQLPDWIEERLRTRGKNVEPQALALLAEQVEGNLLAASQEIDKLCLLTEGSSISVADVNNSVSDNARYEVFALLESAMTGDARRCIRMLSGLCAEGLEPISIHAPLIWEFRRVCSLACQAAAGTSPDQLFGTYRVWNDQRKHAIRSLLRRCNLRQLHILLVQALRIERKIKSSDQDMAWQMLLDLLLAIAGKSLTTATGTTA